MTWRLDIGPGAQKQLRKLGPGTGDRIVRAILRDLDRHGDPRGFGESMVGEWSGFWRYRVADYRAICRIEDAVVTVHVVLVAHRREVYR